MDDAAFLAAIRATPSDRTPRLAYADWLQERGDPRHELIRVCEAMRRVPVFADEYWRLKARRNELWAACPVEWLAATGYDGGDYDPVFRDGVPDDCTGRWRLVREYTERWCGVGTPDGGGWAGEVRRAEERVGRPLSPALREWLAYAHDLRLSGTAAYDERAELPILDQYALDPLALHPGVAVLDPHLGDPSFWVPFDAWDGPDPPVYRVDYDPDGEGTVDPRPHPFRLVTPSLAWMALGRLGHEMQAAGEVFGPVSDPAAVAARLAAEFPIRARWADTDIFERDEVKVFVAHGRSADSFPGYISLRVRRPVPRESLPAYLLPENTQTGGAYIGGRVGEVNVQWAGMLRPGGRPPGGGRGPVRWRSVFTRQADERRRRAEPRTPAPPLPPVGDDIPF